ncbi:MAG: DEAD/DEAH box helicase family protein [Lachnospiraceae bacterium]|nr:DEAD/DEAH box helicase family protein [Lachnospiraceae bacterium]
MFENIRFKYEFRDYQKRILDNMEYIFEDNKLHISAAPGAGKTILGLEVVRRLGKKALILVPTINLRNQWKDRFFGEFVEAPGSAMDSNQMQSNPSSGIFTNQMPSNSGQAIPPNINFSTDISSPGDITCSTYQGLYAVFSRDEKQAEFKKLIKIYKDMGVETICLDEAHHLKREWWNALTEFLKGMKIKLIALTATPPMDTSDIEWKRYIELCGPIDQEISIPEMVAKKCLCPHQDYIYICKPTDSELREIEEEIIRNRECIINVLRDSSLYFQIKEQPLFKAPSENARKLVKNPDYLMYLLKYLTFIRATWQVEFEGDREKAEHAFDGWDKNIRQYFDEMYMAEVDRQTQSQSKNTQSDPQNIQGYNSPIFARLKPDRFFLPLMKDILEDSPEDYSEDLRLRITEILTKNHLMKNEKVSTSLLSDYLKKKMRNTSSKLHSIEEIVRHETASIGRNLRCLVLMDYIRKEDLKKIETDEALTDPGVLTAFEQLRRQEHLGNLEMYFERQSAGNQPATKNYRQRIGVLTGSLVILPDAVMDELGRRICNGGKLKNIQEPGGQPVQTQNIQEPSGQPEQTQNIQEPGGQPANALNSGVDDRQMTTPNNLTLNAKKLGLTGYSIFEGSESTKDSIVGAVTDLFSEGKVEILIGTAALLGEGWDAPSVNTLILGSNSTMYVRTNQMRGRALRIDRNQPEKVSNIWHLMEASVSFYKFVDVSFGQKIMEERFNSIVGLRIDGKGIESGLDRMLTPEHTFDNEDLWNGWMMSKSVDRNSVRREWEELTAVFGMKDIREVVDIPKQIYKVPLRDRFKKNVITPKQTDIFAKALVNVLKNKGYISESAAFHKETTETGVNYYLDAPSEREGRIFADCMKQIVSPLYMPKYMVTIGLFFKKYVAVPDLLAGNKKSAEEFGKAVGKKSKLIYVNTDEGLRILLEQKLRQRTASKKSVELLRRLI